MVNKAFAHGGTDVEKQVTNQHQVRQIHPDGETQHVFAFQVVEECPHQPKVEYQRKPYHGVQKVFIGNLVVGIVGRQRVGENQQAEVVECR